MGKNVSHIAPKRPLGRGRGKFLNYAFLAVGATLLLSLSAMASRGPALGPGIDEPEMVYVEGGTFMMGSLRSEEERFADEDLHQVTVGSFRIGKYEVTRGLWKAVMGSYPILLPKGKEDYPVVHVSWDDAQEFIRKLNAKTGKKYRLPTEAEWEFAARGGNRNNGNLYSGGDSLGDVAWHRGNSGVSAHPVGRKSANELGIYDMIGNVSEWCSDRYGDYPTSPQTNPKGPSSAPHSFRVSRGGSYFQNASGCRPAKRECTYHSLSVANIGFRLASDVPR
ncbi:MAG: formylglycine-generating enzyme family protein [Mediterranea sp.]|nr:formylglycine-generating enzyme family protein [Mediterranea sp.]